MRGDRFVQVLEEGLGRRGEAVAALRPTILRTLADATKYHVME
jgi:hypothetical protein